MMSATTVPTLTMERWFDDSELGHLARYYAGFAAYQRVLLAGGDAARLELLRSAERLLVEAVARRPRFVDAHALLNPVFSAYYRYDPPRAGVVGPMADEHLQTALRIEPNNPQAVTFRGLDLFYSPPRYGGDKAAGLEMLRQALELFETGSATATLEPGWGRAAAHVWYAEALAQHLPEKRAEAIASVERALEIAPGFPAATAALADLRREH